jgi:hypothetical protein
MDGTEIDLSSLSIGEACMWLLTALDVDRFDNYAYTIPFSSYVMTWPRAVPLDTILILQSPYPNNIFPPIAAAMSFDSDLCRKEMRGRELPPTVQVLANDLYINAGMEKEDSISILKNGWALIDKGILMFNEAAFNMYDKEEAYIESIKQCAVIIRLLQETERYGKRTVNIFAFGESGERVGSNLCSWFKSPIVRLTKRKVTHPAGIARRFDNLDDPDCHMATASFSKALAKVFSNHVAFMHTMGKKSEQDLRTVRLDNTFTSLREHFPKLGDTVIEFTTLQQKFSEMDKDDKEYKDTLAKIVEAGDILASRLRIATSIVSQAQSYGSSVAGNVARSAPSMKTDRPTESLLSGHVGRDPTPASALPDAPFVVRSKKRVPSASVKTESFTNVSPPPSISSVISDSPTPSSAVPAIKFKTKSKSRNTTPLKQVVSKDIPEPVKEIEHEDVLSPLTKKFSKKVTVPKSKNKIIDAEEKDEDVFNDSILTDKQLRILSSIQGIVEINKPNAVDDDDCITDFDNISNDIKFKRAYNFITQDFLKAINQDIKTIPNFDINKWLSGTTDTCATFEMCKEKFEF